MIERLAMKDGALSLSEGKQPFLRMDDLDFESRLAARRLGLGRQGRSAHRHHRPRRVPLRCASVEAPIAVSKRGLGLEPIAARLAGGAVKGKIRLDLARTCAGPWT